MSFVSFYKKKKKREREREAINKVKGTKDDTEEKEKPE